MFQLCSNNAGVRWTVRTTAALLPHPLQRWQGQQLCRCLLTLCEIVCQGASSLAHVSQNTLQPQDFFSPFFFRSSLVFLQTNDVELVLNNQPCPFHLGSSTWAYLLPVGLHFVGHLPRIWVSLLTPFILSCSLQNYALQAIFLRVI